MFVGKELLATCVEVEYLLWKAHCLSEDFPPKIWVIYSFEKVSLIPSLGRLKTALYNRYTNVVIPSLGRLKTALYNRYTNVVLILLKDTTVYCSCSWWNE